MNDDAVTELRRIGVAAEGFVCDVTDEELVDRAMRETVRLTRRR
jgi:hypothetical protein